MNKRQWQLDQVKQDIINNEKEDIEDYYGNVNLVYHNIDKYIDALDNTYDKIALAQWANNYGKAKEMISNLNLSNEEKIKYQQLKNKNIDLDETLNFELLSSKYAFLNDMLDMITTDIKVQERIVSLSDEELELFKTMYTRLQEVWDCNVGYVDDMLKRVGEITPLDSAINKAHYYDNLSKEIGRLIRDGYKLSDKDLDTLLFIYNSDANWNVQNMWELRSFGLSNSKDQLEIDEMVDSEREKDEKNVDNIKAALLYRTYGMSLPKAKDICKMYQISHLDITEDNLDLFEMYQAIAQIVSENDPDILIDVFDSFNKEMNPNLDFMRVTTFENDLRKEFAKSLNQQVYQIQDQNSLVLDGVNVYEVDEDFKMIVTAVGAYQSNFKSPDNYSQYWNSTNIRSHGNCCSLISNSNLSMATVRNVILGFSTMSDNMLLLSGSRDINSTPDSQKFNTCESRNKVFMSPEDLIDNTRGDYNELVFERRDLGNNTAFYKKNPDYIVFVEEYENIQEYFDKYKDSPKNIAFLSKQQQMQENFWHESLKAAKDLGIPIVKINREKCAKKELAHINSMVNDFSITKDPDLIDKIINKYESNRVGNTEQHIPIRERYFSKKRMNGILDQLVFTIEEVTDLDQRNLLVSAYKKAILNEKRKVDEDKLYRHKGQTSAIDFDKELNRVNSLYTSYEMDYDSTISKPTISRR